MTKAEALLSVVEEIYQDGKDIIGPRWSLLDKMKEHFERGDVREMVNYYERCLASDRGKAVAERLRRAGRKTMELEHGRFMRIFYEIE